MKMVFSFLAASGSFWGCHQRADRSFFIHGKQLPVCARCTGVFIGECFAICCFRFISLAIPLLLLFCAIMILDWSIQYVGWKESSNGRRFVTGVLCGYGYITLVLKGLVVIKNTLF